MLNSGYWCEDEDNKEIGMPIWRRERRFGYGSKRVLFYNLMYIVDFSFKLEPFLDSSDKVHEATICIDIYTPYLHEDTKYTVEKRVRLSSYNALNSLVRENARITNQ